jgi:integrase
VRKKGPVSRFADLLDPGQKLPVTAAEARELESRVRTWIAKGAVVAAPPVGQLTFGGLLDRWLAAREVQAKVKGKAATKEDSYNVESARKFFGALPVEQVVPETLNQFVLAYLNRGRKIATPNRIIAGVVRPAIKWGCAQRPPLVPWDPFGRYAFQLDTAAEEKRKRRCEPEEEAELLDAAEILNTGEHSYCGAYLRDAIILGIDLGARQGEILALRNVHVDWRDHSVVFVDTKRGEARTVPFNPEGRVAAILERRRFAGPEGAIIANHDGDPVKTFYRGWVHLVLLAHGKPFVQSGRGSRPTPACIADYKAINLWFHDLRHEALTWWGWCGLPTETGEWLAGHRTQTMHGRYRHEDFRKAVKELSEFVWPKEGERAVTGRKRAWA